MYWNMTGILVLVLLALVSAVHSSDTCKDDITATLQTAVTSSSDMAPNDKTKNYGADRSPINTTQTVDANGVTQMGGWVAEKNNFNQWIQIELKDVSLIRGLITQGRSGCCTQWVTKYRVLYSEDCKTWTTVGGFNVTDAFFSGNTDENTPVTNLFHCPVMAKCIRVNPLGWNKDIAMRVGLLGCGLNSNPSATSTSPTTTIPSSAATSAQTSSTAAPISTTAAPTTVSIPSTTSTKATPIVQSSSTVLTSSLNAGQSVTSSPATTTLRPVPTQKAGKPLAAGSCVKSCKGLQNGDYQSCKGCDIYITCNWDLEYDNRPCSKGTKWDDKKKECVFISSTCP